LQTLVRIPWIPSIGAEFHLAADAYSWSLVALTWLLTVLAMVASPGRRAAFHVCLTLVSLSATVVFLAADLLLFFAAWEAALIPTYFLIAQWGGEKRHGAAMKFLIYTNLGGMIMLLGILRQYAGAGMQSFALADLAKAPGEAWVFWAILAGCAVKVPLLPLHTWLPDAHTEAPTAGSVLLAGVLLKMGTYGILRMALPFAPPDRAVLDGLAWLSVAAILYAAIVCLMQRDWKRLIAYSSVSHMGFCTLGMFTNATGIAGSMLQQVNHGITTGLLFLLVGAAYDRTHTREISAYGGLARRMPVFTGMFLIAALGSMGLPPLNGFIGELTILRGALAVRVSWALAGAVGVLLGGAYLLWLFQRVSFGEPKSPLLDLTWRERLAFAPLVALTIGLGVYPAPLLERLSSVADEMARRLP
jgi:NADH-quinone oxidoreductase subunit M